MLNQKITIKTITKTVRSQAICLLLIKYDQDTVSFCDYNIHIIITRVINIQCIMRIEKQIKLCKIYDINIDNQ